MVTDAQNTIVKEFEGNPRVVAAIFQEGETAALLNAFWTNVFLRDFVLWDPNQQNSSKYKLPSTGLPKGRGFIIDQQGKVAVPYFGYDPNETIRQIYDLIGFTTFGKGCASTSTLPSVQCSSKPRLGQKFVLDIAGFLPNRSGQIVFGGSNTVFAGVPLPIPLGFMGMGNCSLWVSLDLAQTLVTDSSGSARLEMLVPNTPALRGVFLYGQAWAQDRNANAAGAATSHAFEAVVGS